MLNLKNGLLALSLSLFASQVVMAETAKMPPVTGGMVLHLDASDLDANGIVDTGYVSGEKVGNWRDKSTYKDNNVNNDNNAYPVDDSKSPKRLRNQLNGKGTVAFKNSGMSISSIDGDAATGTILIPTDAAYTKVVLFKIDKEPAQNNLISEDTMALFAGDTANPSDKKGFLKVWHESGASFLKGASLISHADYHIAVARYGAGAPAPALKNLLKLDGSKIAENTTVKTHAASTTYIGSIGQGNFLRGEIAEAIVYNRALSDADIIKVEKYLKEKWGGLKANKIKFKVAATKKEKGSTMVLKATSSSKLAVRFATSTPSICSIVKTNNIFKVSFKAIGKCILDADQAGNTDFQKAKTISQTITVSAATPPPSSNGGGNTTTSSGKSGGSLPATLLMFLGLLIVRRLRLT